MTVSTFPSTNARAAVNLGLGVVFCLWLMWMDTTGREVSEFVVTLLAAFIFGDSGLAVLQFAKKRNTDREYVLAKAELERAQHTPVQAWGTIDPDGPLPLAPGQPIDPALPNPVDG